MVLLDGREHSCWSQSRHRLRADIALAHLSGPPDSVTVDTSFTSRVEGSWPELVLPWCHFGCRIVARRSSSLNNSSIDESGQSQDHRPSAGASPLVTEAMVLSTCSRVVYAVVDARSMATVGDRAGAPNAYVDGGADQYAPMSATARRQLSTYRGCQRRSRR